MNAYLDRLVATTRHNVGGYTLVVRHGRVVEAFRGNKPLENDPRGGYFRDGCLVVTFDYLTLDGQRSIVIRLVDMTTSQTTIIGEIK